jgi:hypothetical protein
MIGHGSRGSGVGEESRPPGAPLESREIARRSHQAASPVRQQEDGRNRIPTGPFERVAAAASASAERAQTVARRPDARAAAIQQRVAPVVNAVSVMSIEHHAARRKNWLVVARRAAPRNPVASSKSLRPRRHVSRTDAIAASSEGQAVRRLRSPLRSGTKRSETSQKKTGGLSA